MNHKLIIESNPYTRGYTGICECSDPDWVDNGWEGQVQFEGFTAQEVQDWHADHVTEVAE